MGNEFDIDLVYGNISKLMKDQEIKVSEMETIMGISAGYFSKLIKNKTVLGSDVLFKVAQRLGVTIDLLINCNLTIDRATDNLRLMTRFLRKLRTDTDETRINWHATTADSLILDSILSIAERSIIVNVQSAGNPLEGTLGYYGNESTPNKIDFDGQIFYVDIEGTRIFVSHLVEYVNGGTHAGEAISYYAVDACEKYKTRFVCSSRHSPELLAELELLYECLKRHAADLTISDSVRGFIEAYVSSQHSLDQIIDSLNSTPKGKIPDVSSEE